MITNRYERIRLAAIATVVVMALAVQAMGAAIQSDVPTGTELRIRLDQTLSSKEARVGDRFAATVVEGHYNGAKIYGRVEKIKPSGRFKGATEMYLTFNEIRLADGIRSPMAAEIVRLYDTQTGEYVDAEGGIETKGRGQQTLKRTGIGALAGGVFGAIFSGAGAAIGSVVGGAAGAGTTASKGGKALVLEEGTEMLIRTIRQ